MVFRYFRSRIKFRKISWKKKKIGKNDESIGESTLKWNIENIKKKIVKLFDCSVQYLHSKKKMH